VSDAARAPAPAADTAPPRAQGAAPPDASAAPPAAPAAPTALAPPPSGLIDLLRVPGARVAVSSVVQNNTDRPSNLVDGDLQTAWSSQTGQMEGARIGIYVPEAATVEAIRLTVGIPRQTAAGDLFTMNPRIARLTLSSEGNEQFTDLNTNTRDRGLQSFAVHQRGGYLQLVVDAGVPGTESRWREVSISELQVLGTLPGPAPAPVAPRVQVGVLYRDELSQTPAPWPADEPPVGCFGWSARLSAAACTVGVLSTGRFDRPSWHLIFPGAPSLAPVDLSHGSAAPRTLALVRGRLSRGGFIGVAGSEFPLTDGVPLEWRDGVAFEVRHTQVTPGREISPQQSEDPTYDSVVRLRWDAHAPWTRLGLISGSTSRPTVSVAFIPGGQFVAISRDHEYGGEGWTATNSTVWLCDRPLRACNCFNGRPDVPGGAEPCQ
jgi:hypothetical protein